MKGTPQDYINELIDGILNEECNNELIIGILNPLAVPRVWLMGSIVKNQFKLK